MVTNWKEQAKSARFRSDIYGLLATIFRQEPGLALIRELRDPQLTGVFSDLGVDLGEAFCDTPETELVEVLALEFTRLFIGPSSHISAHESIFAEMDNGISALWGQTTVAVKNFIETTGLDYKTEFTGVPDHVSVELEFMQKLSAWEADKWLQNEPDDAKFCQQVQRMFFEQHLMSWLPQFCDVVMEQADIRFYAAMAELTKNYLEFEQQGITADAAA
ncbi:MAG: molecular chaperone TorD family protein [Gammaproteobacteria bacterium]|nr:molecular chaperone TorD family protein [Gammaproteobacteria bacterium]